MSELSYTGERIVPGMTGLQVFREHQMRYRFAGKYVGGRVVLDVASGTGIGTHFLLNAGAKRCIGLELDQPSLRYAAFTYKGCGFVACDAARICLGDAVADVVVSFETIEHLPNPQQFLSECRRVLRPGGVFICSTPNRTAWRWHPPNPFHVREFTPEEFQEMVNGLFSDCQAYAQCEVKYPRYVLRQLAVRLLEKIRLKGPVMQALQMNMPETRTDTHFEIGARFPELEPRPYIRCWLVKPMYLIVVARKPG